MIELFVYGIILGSIIALGSIGLTLIYGILRFANFAHGDLMTAGAYITLFFVTQLFEWIGIPDNNFGALSFGLRMVISLPIVMMMIAFVSIVIDQILYNPLRSRKSSSVILAMASLGVSFIIQMIVIIVWGADSLFYKPGVLRPAIELPLNIKIRPDQIFIILTVFFSISSLHLFLKYTRTGKAMRATSDNPELARITGIQTKRIIQLTWAIGGAMAALGGVLYGIDVQLHPTMGWGFILPLFSATILGGIGNMHGALIGGLVMGVVQQLSTSLLLPTYKPAIAFVIMILILLVRPQGIFGGRV